MSIVVLPSLTTFCGRGRHISSSFLNAKFNFRSFPKYWNTSHDATRLFSTSHRIPLQENIRNVAIIAHVDHGKTTLVDCLLKQSGNVLSDTRVMDSNVLEKERGITILSKVTSIDYNSHRINIVDTPGHADFGGEVERILCMVDGVVLVVDATEGPMAQTKFVLSKALSRNLKPIVVFNKADRLTSRFEEVDSELLDLFITLSSNEEQMMYDSVFASAREGWAVKENPHTNKDQSFSNMNILLDMIVKNIPCPTGNRSAPFSFLVNSTESNAYLGKCLMGKVESGTVSIGQSIKAINPATGDVTDTGKMTKMFLRRGLEQVNIESAAAGDIVTLCGVEKAKVNYTIGDLSLSTALPVVPVDPPTISMYFSVNLSPLAGKEGKAVTSAALYDRLKKEAENNIALIVSTTSSPDSFEVCGRGELQMGILIETMRREGMEFGVSPPKVLMKTDSASGGKLEPIEEVTIDVDAEYTGSVIEKLSKRKGELVKMSDVCGKSRLVFTVPTRGLIGYASEFKNDTHGTGVLNHVFLNYQPYKGNLEFTKKGAMISMADGSATGYAIADLEARGVLFVQPGTPVYTGMVVGEANRPLDLEVNPTKAKQVTNVRSTIKEEFSRLIPAKIMSIEEMIAYMSEDEMIEITPKSIRLRKQELNSGKRKKSKEASLNN